MGGIATVWNSAWRAVRAVKTDIHSYCDHIPQARLRLDVIQSVIDGKATTGLGACNAEFIFLQFRKVLELIAFASLAANKEFLFRRSQKFSQHWKAKSMLEELAKVNPQFYPDLSNRRRRQRRDLSTLNTRAKAP